jgi:WD40 repeat protein
LWDVRDGECLKTYTGHDKGVTDVEFLPDGHHFVSASFDGTIVLWETFTGNKVYSFVDHTGPVNCLDVSRDGKYLASGGVDKRVYVWALGKKIFVDYYFKDEIDKVVSESDLFLPKQKGEDKEAYLQRQEKAEKYLNLKVDEYYNEYLKSLNEQHIKK